MLVRMMAAMAAAAVVAGGASARELGIEAPPLTGVEWIVGEPVTLGDSDEDRVYVVEFWATWCPPCRDSIPHLTELQKQYADNNVVIIGISDESPEVVAQFAEAQGEAMQYHVAAAPERGPHKAYMDAFGQGGIPTAFIVNREGRIAWVGHPMNMDAPLAAIVEGSHDIDRAKLEMAAMGAVEQAVQRAFRGDMEALHTDAKAILENYIEVPQAVLELAWLILNIEDAGEENLALAGEMAETAFNAMDEPPAIAHLVHAVALGEHGKTAEAIEVMQAGLKKADDNPRLTEVMENALKDLEELDNVGTEESAVESAKEIVLEDLQNQAEAGNTDAQYELAAMYHQGIGLPQSFSRAAHWFRNAAEKGHAEAQFHLAVLYYEGKGVAQSYTECVRWAQKAAVVGHSYAQYFLGVLYDEGTGVAQNHQQAAEWFRLAAEQGHIEAQFNLGSLYMDGHGVSRDLDQAKLWFNRAAEQGFAPAHYNLGILSQDGIGGPQDTAEALRRYRIAAELGHAEAQHNLGGHYYLGLGVPQDLLEAAKWRRLASEQGLAEAQLHLGLQYYLGDGVQKNLTQSLKWLMLAEINGHSEASQAKRIVSDEVTSAEMAEARQMVTEWLGSHDRVGAE